MARRSPLIKIFLDYLLIERGLSTNTVKGYSHDLNKLQAWTSANNRQLRALNQRDIEIWLGTLSKQNLNPSSIARALSSVRSFYSFLVTDNHIDTDPTQDVHSPKKIRPLPHVLSITDTMKLLGSANDSSPTGLRDRALLELLYATGLRISEAVTLRHTDLQLERQIVRCHGKGNKERQVPISKSAVLHLQYYFATLTRPQVQPLARVFQHNGNPLTRQLAWTVIRYYAHKAKIQNVTPHTLRHCFATHLLENGASTTEVQLLLGHSHINTTEIYTHVTPRFLRQSYDQHHPRAHALDHTAAVATTKKANALLAN